MLTSEPAGIRSEDFTWIDLRSHSNRKLQNIFTD